MRDGFALIGRILSPGGPGLRALGRAASDWMDVTDLAPGIEFAGRAAWA